MTSTELYNKVIALGIEYGNHESDLYIKKTPESQKLIRQYAYRTNVTTFTNQIDHTAWYDIPFAYQPFWERKTLNKRKDR